MIQINCTCADLQSTIFSEALWKHNLLTHGVGDRSVTEPTRNHARCETCSFWFFIPSSIAGSLAAFDPGNQENLVLDKRGDEGLRQAQWHVDQLGHVVRLVETVGWAVGKTSLLQKTKVDEPPIYAEGVSGLKCNCNLPTLQPLMHAGHFLSKHGIGDSRFNQRPKNCDLWCMNCTLWFDLQVAVFANGFNGQEFMQQHAVEHHIIMAPTNPDRRAQRVKQALDFQIAGRIEPLTRKIDVDDLPE